MWRRYCKEIINLIYGEFGLDGHLKYSILRNYEDTNFEMPKVTEPTYSKLMKALETNMIILLDTFPPTEIKPAIYSTAFSFFSWSNSIELIEKVGNILIEKDDIKRMFLEECLEDIHISKGQKYPYHFKKSQIKILEELSMQNSQEIKNKAKENLDYIDELIDNGVIQIGD